VQMEAIATRLAGRRIGLPLFSRHNAQLRNHRAIT